MTTAADGNDDQTPPTLPMAAASRQGATDPTQQPLSDVGCSVTWETLLQQRAVELAGEETLSMHPGQLPTLPTHANSPDTVNPARDDFPAELTHHGFRTVGLLGQGGLGAVYLAVQPVLERAVAVKVGRSPEAGRQLQAEARAAAAVEHPAVVPIHAAGSGHLVMRHLRGATFGDLRRDGEPLEGLIADLRLVLDGLACAHGHGLLHRDLKPANLMRDERGGVAIIDWGLAVAINAEAESIAPALNHQTVCAGTPAFLPPEVARGDLSAVGPASDVFLIGAVLYYFLSGKAPYTGGQRQALNQAARCAWEPLDSSVDAQLASIQAACMAADPRERPALSLIAESLDRWLADQERLRDAARFAAAARERAGEALAATTAPVAWRIWAEALGLARTAVDLGEGSGDALLAQLQADAVRSALHHGSLVLARHGLSQMAEPPALLVAAVDAAEQRRIAQARRWRRARHLTIAAALTMAIAAGWMWWALAADQAALQQAEVARQTQMLTQAQATLHGPDGHQLAALSQVGMTLAVLDVYKNLDRDDSNDDLNKMHLAEDYATAVADWAIARQRGDWFSHFAPEKALASLPADRAAELSALQQRLGQRWGAVDGALAALSDHPDAPWALAEVVEAVQRLPRDADLGPALTKRLTPLLDAAQPATRLRALELLLNQHPSAAGDACWQLLDDSDPQLRESALRGLAQLRRRADVSALAARLLADPLLGNPDLAQWTDLVDAIAALPMGAADDLRHARVWRQLGMRSRCEEAILAVPEEQRGAEHWDLLLSFYGVINYLGRDERLRLQRWARARLDIGHDIQAARLLFTLYSRFIYPTAEGLDSAIAEVETQLQAAKPDQAFVLWELVRYYQSVFPGPVPAHWHDWRSAAVDSLRRAQASARPLSAAEIAAAIAILAAEFPDEVQRLVQHFNDRFPGTMAWRYWRWVDDGGHRLAHIGILYERHARRPTDHQLLMELARAELDRGDIPRALIMGRLAAARHPRDGECLQAHGLALAAAGHYRAAVARFRQADRALPGNAGVLVPGAAAARQAGLWGDHLYFQQRLAATPRVDDKLLPTLLGHVSAVNGQALDASLTLAAQRPAPYASWWLLLSWEALWPQLLEGPHARRPQAVARAHLQQALAWAAAADADLMPHSAAAVQRRLQAVPQAWRKEAMWQLLAAWVNGNAEDFDRAHERLRTDPGLMRGQLVAAAIEALAYNPGQALYLPPAHRPLRPLQGPPLTQAQRQRLAEQLQIPDRDNESLDNAIKAIPSARLAVDEALSTMDLHQQLADIMKGLPAIDSQWDLPPVHWGDDLPYPQEPAFP